MDLLETSDARLNVDVTDMIKESFLHFLKALSETLAIHQIAVDVWPEQTPSLVLGLGPRGEKSLRSTLLWHVFSLGRQL